MKILNSYISLLFLLFVIVSAVYGSVDEKNEWHLIENERKDFTVQLPAKYLVDNSEKEKIFRLRVAEKDYAATVTADMNRPQGNRNLSLQILAQNKNMKFLKAKRVNIAYYLINSSNNKRKIFWCVIYTNRSTLTFRMSATFENDNHQKFLNRFISSLTLEGKKIFNNFTDNSVADKTVNIQSLKSDQIVLDALAVEDSQQRSLLKASEERIKLFDSRSNNNDQVEEASSDTSNFSRPLVMLRSPRAGYTTSAREKDVQGRVVLSVTYLATGRIGDIELVKSLDPTLESQALKAVRQMKFIPAEKDGKTVDTKRFVEYTFNLY